MRVFAVAVACQACCWLHPRPSPRPGRRLRRRAPAPQRPGRAARRQPAPQVPALPPAPAPFPGWPRSTPTCASRRIAADSVEGKAANDEGQGAQRPEGPRAERKNKALQSAQQKLEQGGTVLNDAARAQLQQEVERQQRDIQRFTEDAQQDVQALQQQLQEEFQRKLNPVVDRVAREKQVHMVFSAADSGLVWARSGDGPDRRHHRAVRRGRRRASPRAAGIAPACPAALSGSGRRTRRRRPSRAHGSRFDTEPDFRRPLDVAGARSTGWLPRYPVVSRRRHRRARAGAPSGRGQERHGQRRVLPGPLSRARR